MLSLLLIAAAPVVQIESCGDVFDVGVVKMLPMRAHLVCVNERVFVWLDSPLPVTEIPDVTALPWGDRATRVEKALRALDSGARGPELSPKDLRMLAQTPHTWTVPVRMLGEGVLPISVLDKDGGDIYLCTTPCTLHIAPGEFHFVRGGGDSDVRRNQESVTLREDSAGIDVLMRAPSQIQFISGAVLTGLAAAMTVLGTILFVTQPYGDPAVAGVIMMSTGPTVVLPIGMPMMLSARLGTPVVAPLGGIHF